MGTRYHITVVSDKRIFKVDHLNQQIITLLEDINLKMSSYLPNSEVSKFNQIRDTQWSPISEQLAKVINKSQEISRLSHGAFDITAATLVNLWGFGPEIHSEFPSNREIDNTLQLTGYHLIDIRLKPPSLKKIKPELQIDLSAIAKGYAVDQVAKLLSTNGYQNYLVEIGGEISAQGKNIKNEPWHVAIENPQGSEKSIHLTLKLTNQSVATSGDYRNYFEKNGKRYSHAINPHTGKPVEHNLASVSVIAKSAMLADAFATAILVMGEKESRPFIKENDLMVNMIIRNKDGTFTSWNNLDSKSFDQ